MERYTRTLAALTEYWRSHRLCAGVLHFCGLAYSRPTEPRGQTSDHFVDIKELTLEPGFAEVVRDAFAPVGLMIDVWEREFVAGSELKVPVAVINDLATPWQGRVSLRLVQGDKAVVRHEQSLEVAGLGREIVTFSLVLPENPGPYRFVAELGTAGAEPVRSLRDIIVVSERTGEVPVSTTESEDK